MLGRKQIILHFKTDSFLMENAKIMFRLWNTNLNKTICWRLALVLFYDIIKISSHSDELECFQFKMQREKI